MKSLSAFIILLYLSITNGYADNIQPAIAINNSLATQQLLQSQTLDLKVSMETDQQTLPADWFLWVETPFGDFYYQLDKGVFSSEVAATYQGELFSFTDYPLFNSTLSQLPTGNYIFNFCVDTVSDGLLNNNNQYCDKNNFYLSQEQGNGSWQIDTGIRFQSAQFNLESAVVADMTAYQTDKGNYRAYLFVAGPGIISAVSDDGLEWNVESGSRLQEGELGHPRVLSLDDGTIKLFGNNYAGIIQAASDDGLNFTLEQSPLIQAQELGENMLSGPSIIQLADGSYRMYFSGLAAPDSGITTQNVYSAGSTDLSTWNIDDGVRIGPKSNNQETQISAEHPYVIARPGGGYRMFFYNNAPTALMTATSSDGLTWSNVEDTGITGNHSPMEGNDPQILSLPNGDWRIYFGDFTPDSGGVIYSATTQAY